MSAAVGRGGGANEACDSTSGFWSLLSEDWVLESRGGGGVTNQYRSCTESNEDEMR